MKYGLPILVCVISFLHGLSAQTTSRSVIASDGGSGQAGGVQLEYTLGELAVDGLTGQPVSMTEGFQQPSLRVEPIDDITQPGPDVDNAAASTPMIALTPNPVTATLAIRFGPQAPEAVALDVHDASGTPVLRRRLDPAYGDASVDMTHLPAGVYYFRFTPTDPRYANTYKIIKIQ